MSKSWEERLAEANAREKQEELEKQREREARNSGKPQLVNLNEDPMLDRKIFIDLNTKKKVIVGRQTKVESERPDLILGGIGI